VKTKIVLILLCVLLFGCSDKDNSFRSSAIEFRDSYIKATDFFDLNTQDSFKALEQIDSDLVESELNKMDNSLSAMSKDIETKDQKELYTQLKSDYEDLQYLLSVHDNLNNLSTDEKIDVGNKLTYIFINRDSMKEKADE
jgi:hypothetical protein